MKASAISAFRTPPTVRDRPAPEPDEGEVVVDVEYASLNGMDLAVWAGAMKDDMPYELPLTLGRDVTASPVMSVPTAQSLGRLADLVASGDLRVPITAAYSLDELAQGLTDFASGKHGKLAVAIR